MAQKHIKRTCRLSFTVDNGTAWKTTFIYLWRKNALPPDDKTQDRHRYKMKQEEKPLLYTYISERYVMFDMCYIGENFSCMGVWDVQMGLNSHLIMKFSLKIANKRLKVILGPIKIRILSTLDKVLHFVCRTHTHIPSKNLLIRV